MKKYNFLITPLSGRNVGTEVFRSLKLTRLYKKIVATDITQFSYGNHVCKTFYVQPYASSKGYIDFISKIVKKEKIDVIIPGSDYELNTLVKHREKLKRLHVHILINSPEVINICMDKSRTVKFLRQNNFPYIKTEEVLLDKIPGPDLFYSLKKRLKCPFIVKPNYFSGGSNAISIIQDGRDWNKFIKNNQQHQDKFIAQEYIDAPGNEYTVGVMSDTSGRIISSFALKRDLTTSASIKMRARNKYNGNAKNEFLVISSGISQGLSGDYRRIRKFAEAVALKLRSRGPLNIQCREYNNKIYVFEINPRFSGTTSIRAVLGHNDVKLIFYSIVKNINLGQQKYKSASVVRGRDVTYKAL